MCCYNQIDGLVQICSNSIANTLELLQPCSKPSLWNLMKKNPQSDENDVVFPVQRKNLEPLNLSHQTYKYPKRKEYHDDVIKRIHFPRYWPFVRGIHRLPVNSLHKSQWRGALIFSLICPWITSWVNNREYGDLRRHLAHYDVTVMTCLRCHGSAQYATEDWQFYHIIPMNVYNWSLYLCPTFMWSSIE